MDSPLSLLTKTKRHVLTLSILFLKIPISQFLNFSISRRPHQSCFLVIPCLALLHINPPRCILSLLYSPSFSSTSPDRYPFHTLCSDLYNYPAMHTENPNVLLYTSTNEIVQLSQLQNRIVRPVVQNDANVCITYTNYTTEVIVFSASFPAAFCFSDCGRVILPSSIKTGPLGISPSRLFASSSSAGSSSNFHSSSPPYALGRLTGSIS